MSDSADKGLLLRWLYARREHPWGLDPGEFDPDRVARTIDLMGRTAFGEGRWFPVEIEGLENIPPPPILLVSNHSGGTTIPDAWGLGFAWYSHFGMSRPIHPSAHEMVFSLDRLGRFFSEHGVVRGDPAIALRVLRDARRDMLVMPGGDIDTWRPYSRRYEVEFGGRTGYAKLALRAGVPIVPVAHAGAHSTLIVLSDGRRFAQAVGLHRLARADVFPVSLALPWGLAFGPVPHLPPPTRLRYLVGQPIYPPVHVPDGELPPPELVRGHDARVRAAMQQLLDQLRATRSSWLG